ncbi:type III pantothenate kinase [Gracilimonas mengyeensis]|uniref:Type III pantothenate kinase n=1 Tax=Gracilimonas mengyeensis TaxID=1302730 RepID=A0A521E0D9_9BACT|nr:type III pantothenate kinase [Gracilimonas mengyeensis]SMO77426.1 pantothenate kinase, type III [Gracilimonas mengyeensis]
MSKFDSASLKKQLFLDVGNTAVKAVYKEGMAWKKVDAHSAQTGKQLILWIENHRDDFSEIVLAGVRTEVQQALVGELQQADFNIKTVTNKDIPRDLLDYETPDTLGIDRFLACYGATFQTKEAVVVIDAGTATTIDYMGRDKIFRGGVIAPGLTAFTELLPKHAPALPNVEVEIPQSWPGKSTIHSLQWGQAGFYKFALQAMLNEYEKEFGQFDLFITGGNRQTIQQLLSMDSKLRPYLIFEGLEKLI